MREAVQAMPALSIEKGALEHLRSLGEAFQASVSNKVLHMDVVLMLKHVRAPVGIEG
jgi:hypothetical protein